MKPDGLQEIERLFQDVDFTKDNLGLETRLWQRIKGAESQGQPAEQELSDEDMDLLAAAGPTACPLAKLFQDVSVGKKEK